jgi:2-amino-4-hydroxy-6-hydroxymethyldihydropteridine diphosphokinase
MVYFLGLGTNLGRRAANLARARRLLEEGGVAVVRASSVYETEPVDLPGQPLFLNQVLEVRTALGPPALLRLSKSIEAALKRVPTVAKGPRTIDVDILLAGDTVLETPDLVVPHPRLHLRNFVLVPLAEIAAEARHPVLGKTVREIAAASPDRARVLKPGRRRLSSGTPRRKKPVRSGV